MPQKHLKNYQAKTRTKIRFDKIDYNFMQAFQNH
ncbi:MAG: phage integrase SAM-like domain-containing protein [Cyclobacteriaceae bacterium]